MWVGNGSSEQMEESEISPKRFSRKPPSIWEWNVISGKKAKKLLWIAHGWKETPEGNIKKKNLELSQINKRKKTVNNSVQKAPQKTKEQSIWVDISPKRKVFTVFIKPGGLAELRGRIWEHLGKPSMKSPGKCFVCLRREIFFACFCWIYQGLFFSPRSVCKDFQSRESCSAL